MTEARSAYMFAVGKKTPEGVTYLALNKRSWTTDINQVRWYAYFKYAYELKEKREAENERPEAMFFVAKAYRNIELCKPGGQKS